MAKNILNIWDADRELWIVCEADPKLSFGGLIFIAEQIRLGGIECYAEGDLVGELAAKAGISRAQAEIEYERPEWAA